MKETRFIEFKERQADTILYSIKDFLRSYALKIRHAKWNYSRWKDLTLMKDPMTLSIYLNLLQEIKPKTILEFGTFDGGAALWMHDMMASLGLPCAIHTFDINKYRVQLPSNQGVQFHQLDNYQIRDFAFDTIINADAHPVLVIEDSHVNVVELLNHVDDYLKPGDYLVVEDTLNKKKYAELQHFLDGKNYLVDQHYCDFWGYNNSWNINSFLKKIG